MQYPAYYPPSKPQQSAPCRPNNWMSSSGSGLPPIRLQDLNCSRDPPALSPRGPVAHRRASLPVHYSGKSRWRWRTICCPCVGPALPCKSRSLLGPMSEGGGGVGGNFTGNSNLHRRPAGRRLARSPRSARVRERDPVRIPARACWGALPSGVATRDSARVSAEAWASGTRLARTCVQSKHV